MNLKDEPAFKALIGAINSLPDELRAQTKYEFLTEIMQGEGGNFSANIWSTLLADFAVACINIGFEPKMVLLNVRREAQKIVDGKLKEQNILLNAPSDKAVN